MLGLQPTGGLGLQMGTPGMMGGGWGGVSEQGFKLKPEMIANLMNPGLGGQSAGNLFSNPAFQDMIWKYGLGMGMGGMGGQQQRPMPPMPQAMPMAQPQFQPMQRAMLGGR